MILFNVNFGESLRKPKRDGAGGQQLLDQDECLHALIHREALLGPDQVLLDKLRPFVDDESDRVRVAPSVLLIDLVLVEECLGVVKDYAAILARCHCGRAAC